MKEKDISKPEKVQLLKSQSKESSFKDRLFSYKAEPKKQDKPAKKFPVATKTWHVPKELIERTKEQAKQQKDYNYVEFEGSSDEKMTQSRIKIIGHHIKKATFPVWKGRKEPLESVLKKKKDKDNTENKS